MTVNSNDLAEIGKELTAAGVDGALFATLRGRFPHLSWTRCDASDVVEEPFQTIGGFDLHLIDTRDHCVHIVSDPEHATGIILATRSATA
ncbi:DUF6129 family protein [Roseibium marinum]|uniref:DUF6129 domain-containing protein n=1 Tax=Roseibium marinum TaxID=281252 RepID=A0A2S3V1M8_9HYPH|nr:DUF6129 family protein [Roseibium marinum]POF33872.1 hypothetical protein CLV41_101321 [Roseibium marinum]